MLMDLRNTNALMFKNPKTGKKWQVTLVRATLAADPTEGQVLNPNDDVPIRGQRA